MNQAITSGSQMFWVDQRKTFKQRGRNTTHYASIGEKTHQVADWLMQEGTVTKADLQDRFDIAPRKMNSLLATLNNMIPVWDDREYVGVVTRDMP